MRRIRIRDYSKVLRVRSDEPTMIVYVIRNRRNGMCYVGQCVSSFRRRYDGTEWWRHLNDGPLNDAVQEEGHEHFEAEILDSGVGSEAELDRLERMYIERFGCVWPHGYNRSHGGRLSKSGLCVESRDRLSLSIGSGEPRQLLNNRTGEIFTFTNIRRFADEHDLLDSEIFAVFKGTSHHTNGWSLPNKPVDRFVFTSPTGERHVMLSGVDGGMRAFCKRNGINWGSAATVTNRPNRRVQGWRVERLSGDQFLPNSERLIAPTNPSTPTA